MKKFLLCFITLMIGSFCFSQSAEYKNALKKAQEYETQKRWCYALGSYYDAIVASDEPELKQDAYDAWNKLATEIYSGKPGYGKFNAFSLHDSWQNLLLDAEKYGSEYGRYCYTFSDLELGDLNYSTKTATYTGNVKAKISDRYDATISVIKAGYSVAYKSDWTDMPYESYWPNNTSQTVTGTNYKVNDCLLYSDKNGYLRNAWAIDSTPHNSGDDGWWSYDEYSLLIDLKINIVDKNGKELVSSKRVLLNGIIDYDNESTTSFSFTGITPDIMDLIDDGEANVNLVGVYQDYGKYNSNDDKGGRAFIKNFPEMQIDMSKLEIYYGVNRDTLAKRFSETVEYKINIGSVNLIKDFTTFVSFKGNSSFDDFNISKIEVPQCLYEQIMGSNPSSYKSDYAPVTNVSYYDAAVFCNKLSMSYNLTPCYSVNGQTDPDLWNYTPGSGNSISGLTVSYTTNGLRLPTSSEWKHAYKSGLASNPYSYSGSNNINDIAWYNGNASNPQNVGKKQPNGADLYDMSGNVWEMAEPDSDSSSVYYYGGSYNNSSYYCEIDDYDYMNKYSRSNYVGFRVIQSKRYIEEQKKQEILKSIATNFGDFSFVQGKWGFYSFDMAKVDTPQFLYEEIMDENPSFSRKDKNLAVDNLSWYDILVFCNLLSERDGLTPCYSVDEITDTTKWNYVPHIGNKIKGKINCNPAANGYRLPSRAEYTFASKYGSDLYDLHEDFIWDDLSDSYKCSKGFRLIKSHRTEELALKKVEIQAIIDSFTDFAIVPGDNDTMNSFAMSKIEVPESLYNSVMGLSDSTSLYPKVSISWLEAITFCNKLSVQEGLEPCYAVDGETDVSKWPFKTGREYNYSTGRYEDKKYTNQLTSGTGTVSYNKKASGYRLPTMAEWKYAANKGTYENTAAISWHSTTTYKNLGETGIHMVATKDPNSLGIYDMFGNVAEWVWDKYESYYGDSRYYLGGSVDTDTPGVNTSSASNYDSQYKYIGFRVIRRVDSEGK